MRTRTAVLAGVAMIVVAVLLVLIALPRAKTTHKMPVRAAALAHEGCVAFGDVYEATRPGTPTDGEVLARRLESAIDKLKRAAADDPKWRDLADAVVRTGDAVNQGDTAGAAEALADTHEQCSATLSR
jgi:hypothetical protein